MKSNIANILTLTRILLIPLVVGFLLIDKLTMAITLFSLAALTDGLDGYLARAFQQTSSLGAFLDPVADKLIVISVTILLVSEPRFHNFILPTLIIISREIIISALREWMAMIGKQHALSVSNLGKWKTTSQMLAVFLCLISNLYSTESILLVLAHIAFYMATLLTILSLLDYLWKAWTVLSPSD